MHMHTHIMQHPSLMWYFNIYLHVEHGIIICTFIQTIMMHGLVHAHIRLVINILYNF